MDVATLLIAHHVLSLGGVRETARELDRPVASVSAALSRLQSHIATPLTTTSGNRTQPTLEGRRLGRELSHGAELVLALAALAAPAHAGPLHRQAARMSISLLALSRFIVVARTGSIRSAATQIGIGQPQLTRQIRSLEQDLGLTLLERTASGAVPTPAGERFLALSKEIEKVWLTISDQAGDRFRRASAMTRIGSVTPLGRESRIAKLLAALASEWMRRHPRHPLYISSTNAEELLSGLSSRLYDVVLLDTTEVPPGVDYRVLSGSGLSLVGAPEVLASHAHDLRRLLMGTPIALPSLKSGLRQKFVRLIGDVLDPAERAELAFVEVDSIPVIANLVVEHGYVALMPQWAISPADTRMSALGLPAAYDIQLTLAWKRGSGGEKAAGDALDILTDAGLVSSHD